MSCEFKPSYFFLTTGDWEPTKSFLFRILSFQFRFLAKFRPWKKNKKALPNVCARRKTVQQLPKLRRTRDLSALLPQPRLLSAELKKKGKLPAMVASSRPIGSIKSRSVSFSDIALLLCLLFRCCRAFRPPAPLLSSIEYILHTLPALLLTSNFHIRRFGSPVFVFFSVFWGLLLRKNLNPWRPLRFTERPTPPT